MFSPTVWSHYLLLILPQLAAMLAVAHRLPVAVRVALAGVIVSSFFQNFRVVTRLEAWIGFDTQAEILAIGLAKALPVLIFAGVVIFGREALARALNGSHRTNEAGGPPQSLERPA